MNPETPHADVVARPDLAQPNNTPLPSAFSLFKPSIEAIQVNLGTFLILTLLPILFFLPLGILSSSSGKISPMVTGATLIVTIILAVIVSFITAAALIHVQLKSSKSEKVSISEAFNAGMHFVWRYVGLSIIVGLFVTLGLLLFIVPGLILIRRYLLSPYYLFDQDLSISEAMKRSAKDSKQNSGAIWGVMGVELLLVLVSIPFTFIPVLGQFAASFLQLTYSCAPALRYFQIKK